MDIEIGKREFLAGLAGLVIIGGRGSNNGFWGGGTTTTGPRFESYSPTQPGGTGITVDLESYGTVAGGIESNDEKYLLTNRHVIDPDYPDSDPEELVGKDVMDSTGRVIAEVAEVSDDGEDIATDWALLTVVDDLDWTSHVLGLPEIAGETQLEVGDRIAVSGATTGLVGGEITDVVEDRPGLGVLFPRLVEYRVDEDVDTGGNSGAWVGQVDDNGEFQPVAIHTFRDDDDCFAVELDEIREDIPLDVVSGGATPDALDGDEHPELVEGVVLSDKVVVSNTGGQSVQEREISLYDPDTGDTVDTQTVTLDPLDVQVIDMEFTHPVELDTGDVVRTT